MMKGGEIRIRARLQAAPQVGLGRAGFSRAATGKNEG